MVMTMEKIVQGNHEKQEQAIDVDSSIGTF
jgi:hypothetical protein